MLEEVKKQSIDIEMIQKTLAKTRKELVQE